jgi:5-methylcytosine-specific restriction protein A
MPTNTSRPCKNRACTHTTKDKSGYCLVCRPEYLAKQAKWHDVNRPTSRQRGYTSNWDKFRRMYLRKHPLCECGQAAVLPHHIIPIADGGEMYSDTNLMPMCRVCHEMLHGRKKGL